MIVTDNLETREAVEDIYNRLLEFIPAAKGLKIRDRGSMAILADTIGIARSAVTGALKRGSVPESFIKYCTKNGISLDYVFGNIKNYNHHRNNPNSKEQWLFNGDDSTLDSAIMIIQKIEERFRSEYGNFYSFAYNHYRVVEALQEAGLRPSFKAMLYAHRFYMSLLEQGMNQRDIQPIMVAHCMSFNNQEEAEVA